MMEEQVKNVIYAQWLLTCENLPGMVQRKIMELYPDPKDLFQVPRQRWEELLTDYQVKVLWKRLRETGCAGKMQEEYEKLKKL